MRSWAGVQGNIGSADTRCARGRAVGDAWNKRDSVGPASHINAGCGTRNQHHSAASAAARSMPIDQGEAMSVPRVSAPSAMCLQGEAGTYAGTPQDNDAAACAAATTRVVECRVIGSGPIRGNGG